MQKEAIDQPACGTIKPDVPTEKQGNGQHGQQPRPPQGLQVMTERDVNTYMESLLEAQQPPQSMATLEVSALAQFRGINQRQGDVERRLTRTQNELEALKGQINRLQGQSEAYVNLLVLAEDSRRAAACNETTDV
jgi:hypothetical protein